LNSSEPDGATQRWRLDLAYDGRAFSGFAYQPQRDTVAGLLRQTLATTLRLDHEPIVVGAGRTDAGVHAFKQVVHVDLPAGARLALEGEALVRSLNRQLRGRIQVLRAEPVDHDFHARFSALWREYRYLVLESAPPGLESTEAWSWSVQGPLDLAAMNRVATSIVGTHDFRAFCQRPPRAAKDEPLRRHVLEAYWERLGDAWVVSPRRAPVARLTIRAESFCHNMVRCLVSTMVAIGQGRLPEGEVGARLESFDRHRLPAPAPAAGLALIDVGYGDGLARWASAERRSPSVG